MPDSQSILSEVESSISTATSSTGSDSSTSSKTYPAIPDGGYGWVINFASFMCHFISDGIAFTFGVIYSDLLMEFGASKSDTSWIGSLFIGIPLICGPIAGLFVNRYGCRVSTIVGGLITSFGLLISSFANSVSMLAATYGVIAGFGLAFVYVPASVIPSFWFEKKRSLATGIAVSGSGVGTFAMAPLMEYLLDMYGWRGSLLILSGMTLNIVLFGALFRPVPGSTDVVDTLSENTSEPSTVELKSINSHKSLCDIDAISLPSRNVPARQFSSEENIPSYMTDIGLLIDHQMSTNVTAEQFKLIEWYEPNRYVHSMENCNRQLDVPLNQALRSTGSLLPLSRHDISSVLTLAERRRMASSCPQLATTVNPGPGLIKTHMRLKIMRKLSNLAKEMCDIRLFAMPVYLLFFISNFLLSYAYDLPYVYLPNYANELKIENASFLISILGIVNMFGQILYGFLGDQKKINTLILYGVSIVVCGSLVTSIPSMTSYSSLAVFSTLFGLFISANFSLETVVVVKILSLDELTKAYSLLMFGQGVASLIGPPIGGKFNYLLSYFRYMAPTSASIPSSEVSSAIIGTCVCTHTHTSRPSASLTEPSTVALQHSVRR